MKKRILAYMAYIDEVLQKDDKNWEEEQKKHLIQIAFYAHERTVHLIVMVLFAICTLLCMLSFVFTEQIMLLILMGAFMVLLIPYVMHYYFLENSVQRMYVQYDAMNNKLGDNFKM